MSGNFHFDTRPEVNVIVCRHRADCKFVQKEKDGRCRHSQEDRASPQRVNDWEQPTENQEQTFCRFNQDVSPSRTRTLARRPNCSPRTSIGRS